MTLASALLAALVQLVHVFDIDPVKKHDALIEWMHDAGNVFPCHMLAKAGCIEGMEDTCPRDLRTKWQGPACYHRDGNPGGRECGDCVLMYATEDGKPDEHRGIKRRGNQDIREYCGIPCAWGFSFK